MDSKRILLLKTLLKSTSETNILKHTTDRKKRSSIKGRRAGRYTLYFMLLAFCAVESVGMSVFGMSELIPGTAAILLIAMSFVLTLFKTNGYLFGFKEYDMLVSMPFRIRDIVADKFLYMFIKSLPVTACISISMLIGYCVGGSFNVWTIIAWLILSLVLPIIPMILASAVGVIIVRIGSVFKHKKLIQTILSFIAIIFAFSLRFIIEKICRGGMIEKTLEGIGKTADRYSRVLFTAGWFTKAVSGLGSGILWFLLTILVTIIVFELFFLLVSVSYTKLNSRLKNNATHKKGKRERTKKHSIVVSIAYKEFKRMVGSTIYVTNVAFGEVLILLGALLALFVDLDQVLGDITQGAPITKTMIIPAIPFIVYFFTGMVATTCCSPSLEGQNYWIMQTLPIDMMTDCKGKMLFNFLLMAPFSLLGVICIGISAGASVTNIIMMSLLALALCVFATIHGMVCGLRHRNLEWENEVEVVKQGAAVGWYLLSNMPIALILVIVAVMLGSVLSVNIICLMFTAAVVILSLVRWMNLKNNIRKMFPYLA